MLIWACLLLVFISSQVVNACYDDPNWHQYFSSSYTCQRYAEMEAGYGWCSEADDVNSIIF